MIIRRGARYKDHAQGQLEDIGLACSVSDDSSSTEVKYRCVGDENDVRMKYSPRMFLGSVLRMTRSGNARRCVHEDCNHWSARSFRIDFQFGMGGCQDLVVFVQWWLKTTLERRRRLLGGIQWTRSGAARPLVSMTWLASRALLSFCVQGVFLAQLLADISETTEVAWRKLGNQSGLIGQVDLEERSRVALIFFRFEYQGNNTKTMAVMRPWAFVSQQTKFVTFANASMSLDFHNFRGCFADLNGEGVPSPTTSVSELYAYPTRDV